MKNILLLFCSLMITAALQAQIIHVYPNPDSLYHTIQSGISAADSWDTVLVAEGTYYEKISFLGKKHLMVASVFLMDGDTSHISHTIIDGSLITHPTNRSVVYFTSGEDSTTVLYGFTVQGGKGTVAPWPDVEGGGIFINNSGAAIRHNRIINNVVNDAGISLSLGSCGAGIDIYPVENSPWVLIENNEIRNNEVISDNSFAIGGGIYACNNVRIQNNIITGNRCTRVDGTGNCEGAGIVSDAIIGTVAESLIINNLFEDNINSGSSCHGAGAFIARVKLTCSGNIFSGNKNIDALTEGYGDGGGIVTSFLVNGSEISGNMFTGNMATPVGGWGGAIFLDVNTSDDGSVLVENNRFHNNSAEQGGAIATLDIRLLGQNNVFSGNHAGTFGGALCFLNSGSIPDVHPVVLINNSFSGNNAELSGGAIYSTDANPYIFNSILWRDSLTNAFPQEISINSGFIEIAASDIDTSFISGTFLFENNLINIDPLFTDPITLLTEHWSPCTDAGLEGCTCNHGITYEAPDYDINGAPRPTGAEYDMGAYDREYWPVGMRIFTNDELRVTNWPNPFNCSTSFSYMLQELSQVTLQILNSYGQLVAEPVNCTQSKGDQKIEWNSGDLPAGVYFYRIRVGNRAGTGKMVKL